MPMLSYGKREIVVTEVQEVFGEQDGFSHEAPKFEAYNYGQGRALNIRAEIVIDTEIQIQTPVEERIEKVREMARRADLSDSARRLSKGLEQPSDSLNSQEGDFFVGGSHFQYLPTGETHRSFQRFDLPGVNPGDPITWIVVVEYKDVLGNTYRDIPFGQILEYVPRTAINEFPTIGKGVENPKNVKFQNVDYEDGVVRGEMERNSTLAILTE
ncbi:hypothetical protein GCM10009000_102610 [Halobacterium noricense]